MSRWFRFYDGALDDPKVQRLEPGLFKIWVNLLCVASRHEGKLPPLQDLAFLLRMSEDLLSDCMDVLNEVGLVDDLEGVYEPHNWSKRQHKSDDSNERVKRWRERNRNADVTVTETPPEADTDPDKTEANASVKETRKRAHRPKGVVCPDDWQPKERHFLKAQRAGLTPEMVWAQGEKMRNWSKANSNREVARKSDWDASFDNWLEKVISDGNGTRQANGSSRADGMVAAMARVAAEGDDERLPAEDPGEPRAHYGAAGGGYGGHLGTLRLSGPR